MLQDQRARADRRARQALLCGNLRQRSRQCPKGGEVERTVAPLQHLHGIEAMALQSLHQIGLEWRAAPGRAEGTVARCAAGPAGDLAELGGVELAEPIAVELAIGGKRAMNDVEIQPQAGRSGRDQISTSPDGNAPARCGCAGERAAAPYAPPRWRRIAQRPRTLRRPKITMAEARQPRQLALARRSSRSRGAAAQDARARQHLIMAHGLRAGTSVSRGRRLRMVGEDVAAFQIGG